MDDSRSKNDFAGSVVSLHQEPEVADFQIQWRKLKYTVTNSLLRRVIQKLQGIHDTPKAKTILENVNGQINSGEFIAFMGPSGAGKSTLMECVVGRRVKGRTGDAFIVGDNLENINVSFIAQRNTFFTQLTVRETIYFATKLQTTTKAMHGRSETLLDEDGKFLIIKPGGSQYSKIVTNRVIAELSLESCADNRVANCSGGQLKRLAIAQELVGRPRILVLDEPTSGLDSGSCLQVVQLLRKLCESNLKMAVLASIHQPNQKVLNLFHKLYVLSYSGDVIYENCPTFLVNYFKQFGLICPESYNPADFAIEVASGDYGSEVINKLAHSHQDSYEDTIEQQDNKPLDLLNSNKSFPNWKHAWILAQRNMIFTIRDPLVFGFRLLTVLLVPPYLTSLFKNPVGESGGCPPEFGANFEPSQLDNISDQIKNEIDATFNNIGNIMFGILFVMFNTTMPTCLSFPWELIVFRAEKHNSWYSDQAFYHGKIIAEMPLQAMLALLYWPFQHILQKQSPVFWRLSSICVILFLVQAIAQTFAYIFGIMFMNNLAACIFLGPTAGHIPFLLNCGLFIKITNLSTFFYLMSFLNYVRFSVEGVLTALYGFDRCGDSANELKEGADAFSVWFSAMIGVFDDGSEASSGASNGTVGAPTEIFVEEMVNSISGDFISERNEVRSIVMNIYSLEDWYLYRALIILLIYSLVMRFFVYYLIKVKVRNKNL